MGIGRMLLGGCAVLSSILFGARAQAQVVISQACGAGGVSTSTANVDFVELFNRGPNPQDLTGWTVQISATVTTAWSVTPLSGVLQPGQYFLVQAYTPASAGGIPIPTPDATSSGTSTGVLPNAEGGVALCDSTTPLTAGVCPLPNPSVRDFVKWGGTTMCFEGAGRGPTTASPGYTIFRLDEGCTDTNNNALDFTTNSNSSPTPRNRGTNAFVATMGNGAPTNAGTTFTMGVARRASSPCNVLAGPLVSATADTSALIGGAPGAALTDGGGGNFSVPVSVSAAQPTGEYAIPLTVSDGVTTLLLSYRVRVVGAPPPGDLCTSALVITPATATLTANNALAGHDIDPGTCNTTTVGNFGMWYRFIPATGATLVFDETSTQDVAPGLWAVGTPGTPAADCQTLTATNGLCFAGETWAVRLTPGVAYYLQVGSAAATAPTVPFVANLTWLNTAPSNDACTSALEIPASSGWPQAFTADNRFATDDPIDTCAPTPLNAPHSVWYRFTPLQAGNMFVTETSTQETAITVWSVTSPGAPGTDCPTFAPGNSLACSATEALSFGVTTGNTYYILLHSDLPNPQAPLVPLAGTFDFFQAPLNDVCSSAQVLTLPDASEVPFTIDNRGAGTDLIDVGTCNQGSAATAGVWFRYDATRAGAVTLSETSTQPIAAGVWEVSTAAAACPESGPATLCVNAETISFPVRPGRTYYILVHTDSTTLPTVPLSGTFMFLPAPANDRCADASTLSLPAGVAVPFAVDNRGATPDGIHIGTCSTVGSDTSGVWFRYDASAMGAVFMDENSSQDIATGVWEMDSAVAACPVAGPATICNNSEVFSLAVRPGKTYYILIQTNSSAQATVALQGTFTFAPTPANDSCADAATLTLPAGTIVPFNIDNRGAGPDTIGTGSCNPGSIVNAGAWLRFQASAPGMVVFAETSNQGTGIVVWEVDSPGVCPVPAPATTCAAADSHSFPVRAGKTYYILIYSTSVAQPSSAAVGTFTFLPVPANDTCASATVLSLPTGVGVPFTVDNRGATPDQILIGSCASGSSATASVWFRYDAGAAGVVVVEETSSQPVATGVWEVNTSTATCPTSGPATVCDASETFAFAVRPDKTYFILMRTNSTSFPTVPLAGFFTFAAAPSNDTCAFAATLTLPPDTPVPIATDNRAATGEIIDVGTCTSTPVATASVWFRFDASGPGLVRLSEISTQDIATGVWEMDTVGAACPIFGPATVCEAADALSFFVKPAKTYYILIHTNSTAPPSAALDGTFTFVPAPGNDTCASAVLLSLPSGTPVPLTTDNRGAAPDPIDIGTCSSQAAATAGVWFRFDAGAEGAVVLAETSNQDIATGVWEMDTSAAACPVAAPATFCSNVDSFGFPVRFGKTYYILVHADSAFLPNDALTGSITFVGAPSNDTCAGATMLTLAANTPVPIGTDNRGAATDEIDVGTCNQQFTAYSGVWFRLDASSPGMVLLAETSSQDVAIGVWERSTTSAACPTAGPATVCSGVDSMAFPVQSGNTYYILIHSDSTIPPIVGLAGTFTFVPAPPGDACATAAPLTLPPDTPVPFGVDNRGATPDAITVGPCSFLPTATSGVWFRYDALTTGIVRCAETSAQNIVIGVWETSTASAACPSTGPATLCSIDETFSFPVQSGKTYFILIHTETSAPATVPLVGSFTLTAAPNQDSCASAAALVLPPGTPVPLNVDNQTATPDPIDIGTCNTVAMATAGVWFRYDASAAGVIVVDETSTQDIATGIWEVDTPGAACPTSGPATVCNSAEAFSFPVRSGKTYYILIHTDSLALPSIALSGSITFAPAPANDTCAAAAMPSLPPNTPIPMGMDNRGAGADAIDIGTCNLVSTANSGVWFRYDASTIGTIVVSETSTQNIATGVWEVDTGVAACPSSGPATICNNSETFSFPVRPAKTYYMLIHTDSNTPPIAALAGTLTFIPAPSNDACANAALLNLPPGTPVAIGADNRGATVDAIDIGTCNSVPSATGGVWYRFDATAVGAVVVEETSNQNIATGVWHVSTPAASCPSAGPAPLCNSAEAFSFAVEPGRTYYILIHTDSSTQATVALSGTFTFVPSVANDGCTGAAALTLPDNTPVPLGVDNRSAAPDLFDIGTCNAVSTATSGVWFRFDASTPGVVVIDETSTQDIAAGIWEVDTAGATCPASGPATICNSAETIRFLVRSGKTYYILIHTDSLTVSTVALAGSFTFLPAPPNDTCAAASTLTLPDHTPISIGTDNRGAGADAIDVGPCNLVSEATSGVWFRYDAGALGVIVVSETSLQDTATGVWEMDTSSATCPISGPATICNSTEAFSFSVRPAKTYYILVHTDSTTLPAAALAGTFTFVPAPGNDTCASATSLMLPPGTPVPFADDNRGAGTDAIDIGNCNSVATATSGVWFRFDAGAIGVVVVDETSIQNIVTGVWEMSTPAASCPSAGPATLCNGAEAFFFPVEPDKTYYILIHTDSALPPTDALTGTLTFFPTPFNDDCSAATVIAAPGTFAVANHAALAPTDNSPVNCTASAPMNNDVWYKWTATASGTIGIVMSAFPLPFNGRYAIYDGGPGPGACPTGGAGLIACNAFSGSAVSTPTPTASVVAGNVYFFQIAAQTAGLTGTGVVDFEFAPAQTGSCCAGSSCTMQTAGECTSLSGSFTPGAFCIPAAGMTSTYTGGGGTITTVPGGVFESSITVTDTFSVENVEVEINFTHLSQEDLYISLTNGARTLMLHARGRRGALANPNPASDFNGVYLFADSGTQSVFDFVGASAVTPIPTGTYRPAGVLNLSRGLRRTFNGVAAAGTWTLRIVDHVSGSNGVVNSWTLRLNQGSPQSCAPAGACCNIANGACSISPAGATGCPPGSTFQGSGTACVPNPCPQPLGVCCRGSTCNAATIQADCLASGAAGALFVQPAPACNAGGSTSSPCCHADYNKTGGRTVADLFAFLTDWFAHSPRAVVGGDGVSGTPAVSHIFQFLTAWFAGGC